MTQGAFEIIESYDNWGRLEESKEAVDESLDAIHSFGYNPLGHLTNETVPSGAIYEMNYDVWGRIVERDATNVNDDYAHDYATSAEGKTTVTTTKNSSIVSVEKTDALDRLVLGGLNGNTVSYSYTGTTQTIEPQNQDSRTIVYDFLGRKHSETHPEIGQIQYTLNNSGWVTQINKPGSSFDRKFTFDPIGRVKNMERLSPSEVIVSHNYSGTKGTVTQVTHPSDGVTLNFQDLDDMGRPTKIQLTVPESMLGPDMTPSEAWPRGAQTPAMF